MKRLYIMKQKHVVIAYVKHLLSIHYFLDYSFQRHGMTMNTVMVASRIALHLYR